MFLNQREKEKEQESNVPVPVGTDTVTTLAGRAPGLVIHDTSTAPTAIPGTEGFKTVLNR